MRTKRMPDLTDDVLVNTVAQLNVEQGGGVCTGDISKRICYHVSGILKRLKRLENNGRIKCRYIQGGRLPLWSVSAPDGDTRGEENAQ